MTITEPGSTFFSFIHIPVIAYLLMQTYTAQHTAKIKPAHPFLGPYRWVLVQAILTWSLSTLYHGYHTVFTEHLDYYGAVALLMTYLTVGIWRWGGVVKTRSRFCIGGSVLLYFIGHVCYMENVDFNYDYNMRLCTIVTISKFSLWLRVVYRSPNPQRKRLWVLLSSLGCMSLLELFDFPPVLYYFDAHAIWHACTPVWTVYWTRFLMDDLEQYPIKTSD